MLAKIILSKKEAEKVRNISFYKICFNEKKGIPIDNDGKEMIFPTIEELQKMAFQKLSDKGFNVERVSPSDANCIIHVFKKLHYPYEDEIHNICGYDCFTKKINRWISTSDMGDDFELDFSKCVSRHWLYQDEYIDYDCDFFDVYVKIN